MADPVGLVLSLAKTANYCYQIVRKCRDAPDDILRLNAEISNWRPQLDDLADLLKGNSPSAIRLREKIEDAGLLEVNHLVEELNKILEPLQANPSYFKRAKWVASNTKDKVKDLFTQLHRDMTLVMNLLKMEDTNILRDLRNCLTEITVTGINDSERRNILEWLKPKGIDCEEFHRLKRDLQVEGTCDWLSESWPWLDWCEGGSPISARFLWINGVAGAGKTVLASYAIDQVLSKYQHKGVSYYYCSHERNKKGHTSTEEACSFLRWVIRDLTSQVSRPRSRKSDQKAIIPETLEDLYARHDFSVQKLTECLLSVTRHTYKEFDHQVCIIIDAVDESPLPRDALLNVLTVIGTDPDWQHVSLCFTSRKERDISEAIQAVQPAQPDYSAQLAKIAQQARRARPNRPMILTPVPPSIVLKRREGKLRSNEDISVPQTGFDGRSAFNTTMPPPPTQSENTWERGRTVSGASGGCSNVSQRTSRSEIRRSSGYTTLDASGHERSASTQPSGQSFNEDPMDIDSGSSEQLHSHNCAQGCTVLSMDENPEVNQAIRTFVQKQLRGKRAFSGVEEVISLIANKAKGMFRWAACQVDIINRSTLCDLQSITKMLEKIPPDIFGTYEHMIAELLPSAHGSNVDNQNFARTALALLCSPNSGVSCAEVLVEASRFMVPVGYAKDYDLEQLEEILGCLITVTNVLRPPESMYARGRDDSDKPNVKKQVAMAHYTVKEFLFAEETAEGEAKDFALSKEIIQNLELRVIFRGLQQFIGDRSRGQVPSRYEEYCLKMTDKALKDRRDLIVRDKTIWSTVTKCLRWNSSHNLPNSRAFQPARIRAALTSWAKTSPFESGKEPAHDETSVLVSLLLLQWPELTVLYLADLPGSKKKSIWKDKFELARNFKVEGTDPKTLMEMCVTRRDADFLQALIDSRADFSGEQDLVMDLFYNAYGHRSLGDEDGGAKTGVMLKMLLDRGVRPEAPGYIYTPLQFAVYHLEDRWVHDLLKEGADPNATGNPSGVDPFGSDENIPGDMTPLEICNITKPRLLKSDDGGEELMNQTRLKVELELRQFGAREEDPVESIEVDDSD